MKNRFGVVFAFLILATSVLLVSCGGNTFIPIPDQGLNSPPVVTDIILSGLDLFATFEVMDGANFTVSWTGSNLTEGLGIEQVGHTRRSAHAKIMVLPGYDAVDIDFLKPLGEITFAVSDEIGASAERSERMEYNGVTMSIPGHNSLAFSSRCMMALAGEEIELQLYASPVSPLSSASFRIIVDSAKAQIVSVQPGPFFDAYNAPPVVDPAPNQQPDYLEFGFAVPAQETEVNPKAVLDHTIAVIKLKAIAAGELSISIEQEQSTYHDFDGGTSHWSSITAIVPEPDKSKLTITVLE